MSNNRAPVEQTEISTERSQNVDILCRYSELKKVKHNFPPYVDSAIESFRGGYSMRKGKKISHNDSTYHDMIVMRRSTLSLWTSPQSITQHIYNHEKSIQENDK